MAQRILDVCSEAMALKPGEQPAMFVDGMHGGLGVTIGARLRGWTCPILCNDLYGLVHNLAVVLADPALCMQFHRLVALLPHHRSVFEEARDRVAAAVARGIAGINEAERVLLARDYFVHSWQGFPGLTGARDADGQLAFHRGVNSDWNGPPRTWLMTTGSIAGWHALLTHAVTMENRDTVRLLGELPDTEGMLVYLDPPYLAATRRSGAYTVEGPETDAGAGDLHDRLAQAARRFERATVAVSYYAHPRLEALYPRAEGWRTVSLAKTRGLKRSPGKEVAPEVVVVRSVNLG